MNNPLESIIFREISILMSADVEHSEQAPRIVYDPKLDPGLVADASGIARAMRAMAISEEAISHTTIYLDAQSHYCVNGSVWPKTLGRLRHLRNPELRKSPGNIVRLNTVMCGKPRPTDDVNRTLIHELKHVAQIDQKDKSLIIGHITYWGISALGALAANRLIRKSPRPIPRITITLGGLLLGGHAGYSLAAHERHARKSTEHITTKAVSRDPLVTPIWFVGLGEDSH